MHNKFSRKFVLQKIFLKIALETSHFTDLLQLSVVNVNLINDLSNFLKNETHCSSRVQNMILNHKRKYNDMLSVQEVPLATNFIHNTWQSLIFEPLVSARNNTEIIKLC